MLTLLKPGYKKIISLFYKDKKLKIHLREIARQTKMHEPSVTRCLNVLEEENILKVEIDGNMKKYSLHKNKTAYVLLTIFDLEKQEKLSKRRKEAIHIYLEKLPEKPVFTVLFGSTAKETYKEDSDIDILLIGNKKIQTKEAEKEVDALTAVRISTFQMTYKEFITELKLKQDNVIQSAIHTGYPLLNHIAYYEVLENERV